MVYYQKQKRNVTSRADYFQKIVDSKKNPDKKKYYGFVKRKKNNVFFTITNVNGNVIATQSAGYCKITSKKKKRSPDTIKVVASSISKTIVSKNIKYIYKFYSSFRRAKFIRPIFDSFKKSGVTMLQNVIVKKRPHGSPIKKKS